jgi:hypothetical protein
MTFPELCECGLYRTFISLYQLFVISTVDRNMIQNKEFLYSRMVVQIYFSRTPHLDHKFISLCFSAFFHTSISLSGVGRASNLNLDYIAFLTHHIKTKSLATVLRFSMLIIIYTINDHFNIYISIKKYQNQSQSFKSIRKSLSKKVAFKKHISVTGLS